MKQQMAVLLGFMNSIDFLHMVPTRQVLALYQGSENIRCLAKEGEQYALYFYGGSRPKVRLSAPAGRYLVEWIRPVDGKVVLSEVIDHSHGVIDLDGPEYKVDMALRVTKTDMK